MARLDHAEQAQINTRTVWIVEGGEYDGRFIARAFDDRDEANKFSELGGYGHVFPVHVNAGVAEMAAKLKIITVNFSVSNDRYEYGMAYGNPRYNPDEPGRLNISRDTSGYIVLYAADVPDAIRKARKIVDRAMKQFFEGELVSLFVKPNGEIVRYRWTEPMW